MLRPLILDLFCGAGGAAMGYHRAGFDVVGVDIEPQPHYPFEFVQADALDFVRRIDPSLWDAIHASPPCQFATVYGNNAAHVRADHPNLIPTTREALLASGLPYVIENVEGAQHELNDPVKICGTGLPAQELLRRHRYFESNMPIVGAACNHGRFTDRIFPGSTNRPNGRTVCNIGERRVPLLVQAWVMQVDWVVTLPEISQMVPPTYTEDIGAQLLAELSLRVAA